MCIELRMHTAEPCPHTVLQSRGACTPPAPFSTELHALQVLSSHCGVHVDTAMLKATELRLAGNAAARAGDLRKAEQLFSEVWPRAPCQYACQQSGLGPARER